MKTIIPFGDRILVKRRIIGDKIGKEKVILTSDNTKERPTDLADVVYVADNTFADNEIISNAEIIIKGLTKKMREGDSEALIALLRLNAFLKMKSIKKGDIVMISKYVGVEFEDNQGGGQLTLVKGDDIIGMVIDE